MKREREEEENLDQFKISPKNFYQKFDESKEKVLKELYEKKSAREPKFDETFYHQSEAFQFCDEKGPSYKAWAKEGSKRGIREYYGLTYDQFWDKYYAFPSNMKTYYEIIREGDPCVLYFDLEFYKKNNVGLDGEKLMDLFIPFLLSELDLVFNVKCSVSEIVQLDSSTDEKFSRHVLIRDAIFVNNVECGYFVKMICNKIRKDPNMQLLFVKKEDEKEKKTLFIDEAVYTKNRNFRIYKSTKYGKSSPLVSVDESNRSVNEKDFFLKTLICNVKTDGVFVLNYSLAYMMENMVSSKNEAILEAVPKHQIKSSFSSAKSNSNDVGVHSMYSKYKKLDEFISSVVRKLSGEIGYIKDCISFQSSKTLIYNISNNRFCYNINREHKSNHTYFVVNLNSGRYSQRCFDPDCDGSYFEELLPNELFLWIQSFEEEEPEIKNDVG